jgi:hypothetical protein
MVKRKPAGRHRAKRPINLVDWVQAASVVIRLVDLLQHFGVL